MKIRHPTLFRLIVHSMICAPIVAAISSAASAAPPLVAVYHINKRSSSGVAQALKNLGSKEAELAIQMGCWAAGTDCTGSAMLYTQGAREAARLVGGGGDTSYVEIPMPEGYSACNVYLGSRSMTRETRLAVRILGDRHKIRYTVYTHSSGGIGAAGQFVNALLFVHMVPDDEAGTANCMVAHSTNPQALVVNCIGKNCACSHAGCSVPEGVDRAFAKHLD